MIIILLVLAIYHNLNCAEHNDLRKPLCSVIFFINQAGLFTDQINKLKAQNISEDYEIKIFDQNNSENLILNLKKIVKEFNRESKYHVLVFWDHREDIYQEGLNYLNLSSTLKDIHNYLGKKLDILCLDFCYSSCFEYAFGFKENINYLVACQEKHFMDGFSYDFLNNSFVDTRSLAIKIILDSNLYFLKYDYYNLINFVAIDCSKTYLIKPFLANIINNNRVDLFDLILNKNKNYVISFLRKEIILAYAAGSNSNEKSGISINKCNYSAIT